MDVPTTPPASAASREWLDRTEAMIRERLGADSSGHDWWHIHRVRQAAVAIARREGADEFLVELAALLHDVADWKFHDGDLTAGPRAAREWLTSLGADEELVDRVCAIVESVTFKGAGVATVPATLEGRCVQDADRLDAIGAVGIGRAFAFGGHFGRPMYDPDHPPEWHADFTAYKTKSGPTINHFYEKLLLLKDRMQTDTGRAWAASRHAVLEAFLSQFLNEWSAQDFPGVTPVGADPRRNGA